MTKYGLAILLIISQLCPVLSMESTGPAFMWSPHINMKLEVNVNYQTLSSKDLARTVVSNGGWENIMCDGKIFHQSVDVAVVFVGTELRSSDLSKGSSDASLLGLLKNSFTKSNFSAAYPYVSATAEEGTLESSLVEGFEESCDYELAVGNIVVTESCSINKQHSKVADTRYVQEYAGSIMEKGSKGQTVILVVCHGGLSSLEKLEQLRPEGDAFAELMGSLDSSGAKYAVLYVSKPYNLVLHPIGRLLAEGSGNVSSNSTFCDGVCQIKKSLLEAIFVTVVLLIILISGFCCMMGIDSPTRFETPQES